MTSRCKCGASCDYHDGSPCEGQVLCLNPDAVCPAHACSAHRNDPNALERVAEQRAREAVRAGS